ncbi:MAG: hypothetical protein AAGA20_15415, partial [Planctomycetota bacterium]
MPGTKRTPELGAAAERTLDALLAEHRGRFDEAFGPGAARRAFFAPGRGGTQEHQIPRNNPRIVIHHNGEPR